MTRDEAIELLDHKTQADAIKKAGGGWMGVAAMNKALEMAIDALRAQQTTPNDPFTLEELREMNGEPVFITGMGWKICYGVEDVDGIPAMKLGATIKAYMDNYGQGWFAYRRKPEEGKSKTDKKIYSIWADHFHSRFELVE